MFGKSKPKILFMPGSGLHLLFDGWRLVVIHKTVGEAQGSVTKELIWMGTLGRVSYFEEFVERARQHSFAADSENTVIYTQGDNYRAGHWSKAISKGKRSWESVILDAGMAEEVFADCQRFLNSAEWYRNLGVPYRRSYLLESPPGCGKSSFISALAGRLQFDICFLSLSDKNLTDRSLSVAVRNTPPGSILLLEDLDVAFPDRTKKPKEAKEMDNPYGLTLSV